MGIPLGRWLLPLAGLAGLAALWALGAAIVASTSAQPDRVLPSIGYVFGTALPEIAQVGHEGAKPSLSGALDVIWTESLVTIRRVLLGSAIGLVAGVGLGFAAALNRYARRVVYPPVNLLRQIPLLSLTLLFSIWFAGAERGILAFIAFGVGTMLFVNTIAAVQNVPRAPIDFARTLGASRWRVFRTVVAPAVVPELLSGIQVALGLAWAMCLGAEYLGTQQGLGRLILYFELFQFTGRMIAVVLVFSFWAVLAHFVITAIGNHLTRWSPSKTRTGVLAALVSKQVRPRPQAHTPGEGM